MLKAKYIKKNQTKEIGVLSVFENKLARETEKVQFLFIQDYVMHTKS